MPARHDAIHVLSRGSGPRIVLVHGGAPPAMTWTALEPLTSRWELAIVHRRGYGPSPAPAGRTDFEVDAADVVALLTEPVHLVGHSYGGVGATLAALGRPDMVRSLTLIEPALYRGADRDEAIARARRVSAEVVELGVDAPRESIAEFLHIAGGPPVGGGALSDDVVRAVERIQRNRSPTEADPPLEHLREARVPCLVVSGDHHVGVERACDAVADALGGERLVVPGAGHFAMAAPGFLEPFERFLRRA